MMEGKTYLEFNGKVYKNLEELEKAIKKENKQAKLIIVDDNEKEIDRILEYYHGTLGKLEFLGWYKGKVIFVYFPFS